VALLGALSVGVALSASFALEYDAAASGVFFTAVAIGLVLPTYRAEYVFGFVLGMTFVFGPVLPLIAASIAGGISATAHLIVRPGFSSLLRWVRA
jgi:hypothetical protein